MLAAVLNLSHSWWGKRVNSLVAGNCFALQAVNLLPSPCQWIVPLGLQILFAWWMKSARPFAVCNRVCCICVSSACQFVNNCCDTKLKRFPSQMMWQTTMISSVNWLPSFWVTNSFPSFYNKLPSIMYIQIRLCALLCRGTKKKQESASSVSFQIVSAMPHLQVLWHS